MTVPGPATLDHVPVPDCGGVALSLKSRSHSSPPFPPIAWGWAIKLTVTVELEVHVPLTSVHLNTCVPKAETTAFAEGVFASGLKATLPGPLTLVQVPTPTLGIARRLYSSPQLLPPGPAFETGCW